jgi:hypothetical protein
MKACLIVQKRLRLLQVFGEAAMRAGQASLLPAPAVGVGKGELKGNPETARLSFFWKMGS